MKKVTINPNEPMFSFDERGPYTSTEMKHFISIGRIERETVVSFKNKSYLAETLWRNEFMDREIREMNESKKLPVANVVNVNGREVQTIQATGKYHKAGMLFSVMVIGFSMIGSAITANSGGDTNSLIGWGLLMLIASISWVYFRMGAWWNHG